jgi:cytochrome P450
MFGYGKHTCPGQFLAEIEILLVTKAFLCNFDFCLEPNQDTDPSIPFMAPKSGLELKLTPR